LANRRGTFKKLVDIEGMSVKDALDQIGLRKMCCRMRMMTTVDAIEYVLEQPYYDCKDDLKCPPKDLVAPPVEPTERPYSPTMPFNFKVI
jgi:DNA-directed RNA polymerase subunit N (RpoN/RPB10)